MIFRDQVYYSSGIVPIFNLLIPYRGNEDRHVKEDTVVYAVYILDNSVYPP